MNPFVKHSIFFTLLLFALWSMSFVSAFGQSSDHTCGVPNIHNPELIYGQITDIDGNSYKTVIIDDLVWFAENLKVTRFQNGDLIPNVSESADWSNMTGPGLCSYQNNPENDCPYGKLYNFYTVLDPRNPCPNGWRVPSLSDLYKLIFFLDPNADPQQPGNKPNTAGGALKSSGLSHWRSPNFNATNLSGFSGIPNGGRNNNGLFSFSNDAASSYWLSSQVGPGMGFFLELAYPQDYAVRNAYFAKYGCCIRCVSDLGASNVKDNTLPSYTVLPNPARDYIQIQTNQSLDGIEYVLADLTGRVVLSGKIGSENSIISIAELPNGMYFLRLPTTNGGVAKIIKQ